MPEIAISSNNHGYYCWLWLTKFCLVNKNVGQKEVVFNFGRSKVSKSKFRQKFSKKCRKICISRLKSTFWKHFFTFLRFKIQPNNYSINFMFFRGAILLVFRVKSEYRKNQEYVIHKVLHNFYLTPSTALNLFL